MFLQAPLSARRGGCLTDDEFREMPYPQFYRWYKMALEASDILPNATVTGRPIDPCVVALASKHYTLDRMMKYR
jgi:hypothetical protein